MTIYTVHAPAEVRSPEADPSGLMFVKEGFSWPALFFAPLWLLFNTMWLVLLAYIGFAVVFALAGRLLGGPAVFAVSVLFAFLFALEANELRRWTLRGRGWRLIGLADGRGRAEAEQNYYRKLVAGREAPSRLPVGSLPTGSKAAGGGADAPVVGLFPAGPGR